MALERSLSTDWLGSDPVFYNTKTGAISRSMHEVIDFEDLEFDSEGFNNYLDFGYAVFEQTPVKHVKFLRHSSQVMRKDDGSLEVTHHDDPVADRLSGTGDVDAALERIEGSVRAWEAAQEGDIVIPTSGGFDSRMLNVCIEDSSRVRSFTYGTSDDQKQSSEVAYARELSQILGTRWEQIELGDYHQYMSEWDDLFGASTHAHGMYHIEFYRKILAKTGPGRPLLSGIIGDAWAGSVVLEPITDTGGLRALGYSHGMHADSSFSLLMS
ncbi:MAG: hypothetical protein Q8S35_00765, partial [bacterium]|nr:hypothetical protein [bacterium]